MIDRVNLYYQHPCSKELLKHFREEIGFTEQYLRIFDDLRNTLGDTGFHAENVGLPVKTYNYMVGVLGQHCISELIRLAEIGLKAERKTNE